MKTWLTPLLLSTTALLAPPALAEDCSDHRDLCSQYNYQDLWWDPNQSGMSVNISQQGDTLVATWQHYDDNGNPTWLQASGPVSVLGRWGYNIPSLFTLSFYPGLNDVPLYRATGPAPGPDYSAADVQTTAVGKVSIEFTGANWAHLEYDYNGKSGKLPLQRYTYDIPSLAGQWRFTSIVTDSGTGKASYQSGSAIFSDPVISVTGTPFHHYMITGDLAANPALDIQALRLYATGSVFSASCETGGAQKACYVDEIRVIGDTFLLKGTVSGNAIRLLGVRESD
ncbi:MAG: hypothetical protein LBP86_08595 [Azoarcus sp.]|jgi:hypothetical protein|nr:hypothetical protein [Azoarcus sp.]